MGRMEGMTALVTGASRGIGAAIAERFARDGAHVYVTARTVEEGDHVFPGSIAETVRSIRVAGGSAEAVAADLGRAEERERLVAQVGDVDILVNNAAITYFEPVESFTESHYRLMFEVQVRAPFELAQLVLPGMRLRKRGWILNISSGAARHPQGPPFPVRRTGTVYGMCKAALERFSTGLAAEVYDDGIAVNALSPSRVVATPGVMFHRLIPEGAVVESEPVDVMAEASLVLCSGDPTVLTGKIAYSQELLAEFGGARPTFG